MWSSAVVTVNGELVPCCFDKDANFKMGSLKTSNFLKFGIVKCTALSETKYFQIEVK